MILRNLKKLKFTFVLSEYFLDFKWDKEGGRELFTTKATSGTKLVRTSFKPDLIFPWRFKRDTWTFGTFSGNKSRDNI